MDPDKEENDVFLDDEEPSALGAEEEEEEEDDEDEEEDAVIFNAWMQRCRGEERQNRTGEEGEEAEEAEGGRPQSRRSVEPAVRARVDRRASLPCPATLSEMQLSRLHSSTKVPVTARVLLHRSSSRRLLPPPQEVAAPVAPERRPSLISPIPEAVTPERRGLFRRRNVMSLSDADSMCLICHHDLSQGAGTRELPCTHTFHRECIEERLWRKQSCPTCHIQVPSPVHWSCSRLKVP